MTTTTQQTEMTVTEIELPDSVSQREFAARFNAAALTTAPKRDGRPLLTCVQFELFADGLRMISTNSYALFSAVWVYGDLDDHRHPDQDPKVLETVTVPHSPILKSVISGDIAGVVLSAAGLTVKSSNGTVFTQPPLTYDWPNWRALGDQLPEEQVHPALVGLGAVTLGPLAKLSRIADKHWTGIQLKTDGSSLRPVEVTAGPLWGLIMPVRVS